MKHGKGANNDLDSGSFELVYGKNPVLELIENSSYEVNKIWLSRNLSDEDIKDVVISYAKERKIPFHIVPEDKLNRLAKNQKHQGIVISISPVNYLSTGEIIDHVLKSPSIKIILIADEIEDSHNLGAMIRTFVAAGGRGIILTGRSSVGVNATVIKTSAGALFHAEFARAANCVHVIEKLKESGFWIIGTDNSLSSKSIYETDYPDNLGVLVGNEHSGLGQLIKKNCDFLVKVPLYEKVDSLNVSVAFGIILFEALRRSKK